MQAISLNVAQNFCSMTLTLPISVSTAKEGNMTKGSDGQTIDNMSLKRIEKLIDTLKDETYQPQPSKRVYIPKKNGKKRPSWRADFQ